MGFKAVINKAQKLAHTEHIVLSEWHMLTLCNTCRVKAVYRGTVGERKPCLPQLEEVRRPSEEGYWYLRDEM